MLGLRNCCSRAGTVRGHEAGQCLQCGGGDMRASVI